MNIRNCSRCGRIYVYDGFNICLDCRKADEEDFQKVKKFLEENPNANVMMVSEGTGVETKKIIQFLKEGRLELKGENNIILTCEKCGKPITTGRFCDKCALELERELNGAILSNSLNKTSGRMKEKIRIAERHRARGTK